MASVSGHLQPNGRGKIVFRFGGRQYARRIEVRNSRDLERAVDTVRLALEDIERGRLTIPPDCDIGDFLFAGGRLAAPASPPPSPMTLSEVFATYAAHLTADSKQASSLITERVHRDHFLRLIGGKTLLSSIDLAAADSYIERRAAEGVVRETIEKELATLLVVWKWAHRRGHLASGPSWSKADLTLPKGSEKSPFQTWEQIERRIVAERLEGTAAASAWESLWLDQPRTAACLTWVAEHARHPFIPALFAFAAYTGARRSEMIRSERVDWDIPGGHVLIRQKKADTARKFTTRSVPIHPALAIAMAAWWAACPQSRWAVSTADGGRGGRSLNPRMSQKYFKKTLQQGPWSVLHGWHVFRHSLASNLASAGVDQRVIDQILGHHTAEMGRRYAHLLPQRREHAIKSLFLGS